MHTSPPAPLYKLQMIVLTEKNFTSYGKLSRRHLREFYRQSLGSKEAILESAALNPSSRNSVRK